MAQLKFDLNNEVEKELKKLNKDVPEMMSAMVTAGADVVLKNIRANAPRGIKESPAMMKCLGTTRRAYRTPSDDSVNMKVGFAGYFKNDKGETVPAPLVANVFEYGRSSSKFPKQPFMRKSFKKTAIQKAMEDEQKKYLPED